jgi:hypothetical protein
MPATTCLAVSVADLATLKGRPVISGSGLQEAWIQTPGILAEAHVLRGLEFAPVALRPELPIGGGLARRRFDEHAVMLVQYLGQPEPSAFRYSGNSGSP